MSDIGSPCPTTRRTVLKTAAWSAPVIAFAAQAPAIAASPADQVFHLEFLRTLGLDGALGTSYLRLGVPAGTRAVTLTQPVTLRFDVVAILPNATRRRDYDASAALGTLTESSYNNTTRTVSYVWTLPVGTVMNPISQTTGVPDVLFNWRDGLSPEGRITNKIVVRSIAGGRISQPSTMPIDSSVVKDRGTGTSDNGIY